MSLSFETSRYTVVRDVRGDQKQNCGRRIDQLVSRPKEIHLTQSEPFEALESLVTLGQ